MSNPGLSARPLVVESSNLEAQRRALLEHPLHAALTSPDRLRAFCEHHVYCVWDFMCLLKSLQRELTCVDVYWTPPQHPEAARLINEIVLGEETDEIEPGRVLSHFAWYLEAMEEIGADTKPIRALTAAVASGVSPQVALEVTDVPDASRRFVLQTLRCLAQPLAVRLAVFFFGRENLIPALFLPLVESLAREGLPCTKLMAYLKRHIAVDGESHGPMAQKLLRDLIGDDAKAAQAAFAAASLALRVRQTLWDEIHASYGS